MKANLHLFTALLLISSVTNPVSATSPTIPRQVPNQTVVADAKLNFSVTSIDDQWERVLVQEPCNPATTPRCFGIVEVCLP